MVRRLLAGEAVDHRGRYYALDHCVIDPPPARLGGPPLMVGSIGPRMLGITLPHVQMWNVWFSQYGNSAEGLRRVVDRVHEQLRRVGRPVDEVEGTACVYVQTPRGGGRTMGDPIMSAPPLRGTAGEIAGQLRELAVPGVSHLQLVVDPIDAPSIEWLAEVLEILRR